eukprot:1160142-Pelagomonas_calceolata.AAC.20
MHVLKRMAWHGIVDVRQRVLCWTWRARASARHKWCKTGNQASAVHGHNLSMRTCSTYFLGMPCQVWGRMCGCAHAWGLVKAGSCLLQRTLAQCSKHNFDTSKFIGGIKMQNADTHTSWYELQKMSMSANQQNELQNGRSNQLSVP